MPEQPPTHASDDVIEFNPRSADEVFHRAVALISLVRRAMLETKADAAHQDDEHFAVETDRFELYSWARRELKGVTGDEELEILRNETGSLNPGQVEHCVDALIAGEMLCWSLGKVEQLSEPGQPAEANIDRMLEWVPRPWDSLGKRVHHESLREDEAIAMERERRELWYWRSSLRIEDFESSEHMDAAIAETAGEALNAGLLNVTGGDFVFKGQTVASLSFEHLADIQYLAGLQLRALNWVCGFGASWDTVPLYPD